MLEPCGNGVIGYVRDGVVGEVRESLYTGTHLSVEKEANELIAAWKSQQK